ncbi:CRTAC1 family protein [Rhizobium glycinendophyticum]|uniref:CRTAC1 family protein n=1 Tax=Rhizobium glycinendophyticum TaxID=2589807 RepID=A0A504UJN4_9HYPH|nr:CRTAC1 family protein [Rhizobium glycinendophyticum]TPP09496.1 CRTAC1 family protein [Rhizobium glycinendophyticum]
MTGARLFIRLAATILALPLVVSSGRAADGPLVPSFADETGTSGIASTYRGDWEFMVGGGAGSFDCNKDGFPDLVLSGGEDKAKFYLNRSEPGGALKFEERASGLELDKVIGAYPLDVDGDGHQDVVLLRSGENVVMRGLGECRFERANEAWGFDGGDAWSTAFSATWEKGATWPTIAIGNYIDRFEDIEPWGSCTDNWLQRPATNGKPGFAPPLPLNPSFCPLSILFTDWDRSGTPSLRVSNDREYYKGGQEQMWHMPAGQPPVLYTQAEGWKYLRIWGMGIATRDLDFDGYPEYFLTSMADNKLQKLGEIPADGKPKPSYADVAFAKGATAHRPYTGGEIRPSTAWHTDFEDVNNDGRADLFIAKGNVAKMPDFAERDPNNLLIQSADGKFTEMGDQAGVASMATGRGGALSDFNLDGKVDLLVVNQSSPVEIWRNATEGANHFLQIALRQDGPNRDAIGAWIEVKTGDVIQRREITIGGGHASGKLGWWHFGLGQQAETEIRVLWPDGEAGEWAKVSTDGFYVVEHGVAPRAWKPGEGL